MQLLVEFLRVAASVMPEILAVARGFCRIRGLVLPPDLMADLAEVDAEIDRRLKANEDDADA